MFELLKGREFQLWYYHVSHGELLIRSPAGLDFETTVDIICVAVDYLAAPRLLGEITVFEATKDETERVERSLGKKLTLPSKVWALENSHDRFLVAGVLAGVEEHRGNIFEVPFHTQFVATGYSK